jgi:hypothetical protein
VLQLVVNQIAYNQSVSLAKLHHALILLAALAALGWWHSSRDRCHSSRDGWHGSRDGRHGGRDRWHGGRDGRHGGRHLVILATLLAALASTAVPLAALGWWHGGHRRHGGRYGRHCGYRR